MIGAFKRSPSGRIKQGLASVDCLPITNHELFSRLKPMTIDLLSIEALSNGLSEKALDYLQQTIPEHHRRGVGSFVQAQRRLFNDHAADLAAVLTAIASAPKEFNLDLF